MQPIRLPSLTREIELMEEEERSPSPRLDSEQPHQPHQPQPQPQPQPYQTQYQFQLHPAGVAAAASGGSDAAAGTSAGASGRRSERWAKQSDWDAHRDIITSLYRDRGLTLKRVKETMEREYQFYSTERMYKFRLKQWGVAKYIKQRDMGGVAVGVAANPAAAEAGFVEDYAVGRHDSDYGQGAGTHTHGRYYPFVHIQSLPDGSISDVRLQLIKALPGAPKADASRPPPPYARPLAYRARDRGRVLRPTPPWPYPATISRSLVPAGDVRVLDICVGQLQRFVVSVREEGSLGPSALDSSIEGGAQRIGWTFAVGKAVTDIHLGRIANGFRQLDAAFDQYQLSLGAGDPAFLLKLTTTLALLSDQGLPGLDAIFLRYVSCAVSVVLSPSHPFAAVTRQLLAMGTSASLRMAWYLLRLYTEMLQQPVTGTEQPSDVLSELSWDLSRGVDRDYAAALSEHPGEWGEDMATTALLLAQVHITQRMYGAARRAIGGLLAQQAQTQAQAATAGGTRSSSPEAGDALVVALALRKRWDVSRAEGGDHGAVCQDATALIRHCRAALGPAHYVTARAVDEHEGYLRARRAAAAAAGGDGDGDAAEEAEEDMDPTAAAAWAEECFVDDEPPGG